MPKMSHPSVSSLPFDNTINKSTLITKHNYSYKYQEYYTKHIIQNISYKTFDARIIRYLDSLELQLSVDYLTDPQPRIVPGIDQSILLTTTNIKKTYQLHTPGNW